MLFTSNCLFQQIILFLATFIIVVRTVRFIELPMPIYYLSLIVVSLITITSLRKFFLNKEMLFFILILGISVIVNEIPAIFSPFSRLLSLYIVLVGVGPLFSNRTHWFLVSKMFRYFIFFFFIILLLSFMMQSFFTDVYFQGITSQSMILSPIAGICIIYLTSYFRENSKRMKYLKQILIGLLLFVSFIILLLSASRAAIVSTFLGVVFLFYLTRKNMKSFIKMLITVCFILIVISPLWYPKLENIMRKQEIQASMDGGNSRTDIWNSRITEFESSPVWGIGFAHVFTTSAGYKDDSTGVVEYGSFYLGLLSTTGLVGLLFYLTVFVKTFRRLYRLDNSPIRNLLLSLLLFFAFHCIFEGYALSAGATLSVFFWLILGYANDLVRLNCTQNDNSFTNKHRNQFRLHRSYR